MFMVKIQDAAKRAGLEAIFVKSAADALMQAKQNPALMILDLNQIGSNPIALIGQLKTDEQTKDLKLIGFVSHVQTDLRRAAEEQGCDAVIARSVFSQNLPGLLVQYTGS